MIDINKIYNMDCREGLKLIDENSIDSIVTDPPYELGFMGKAWDKTGIAYDVEMWKECLRVLKPGGYLLSFGGTRTYHRMACAIEDAGFEIRDSIQEFFETDDMAKSFLESLSLEQIDTFFRLLDAYGLSGQMAWVYGSGFPKSMNISMAIDKAMGAEREAAKQWEGWGTALKPANEPICVARKPLDGTVAENFLKWRTGGINIDACRIPTDEILKSGSGVIPCRNDEKVSRKRHGEESANKIYPENGATDFSMKPGVRGGDPLGRWPANVIFDEVSANMLDEQSGALKSGFMKADTQRNADGGYNGGFPVDRVGTRDTYGDIGGASRFFYCAKPSQCERNFGCENMDSITAGQMTGGRKEGSAGLKSPRAGAGRTNGGKNFHPTVKPLKLIEYLVTLVTPKGGISLDPFEGSGTHQRACIALGFNFIGFEIGKQYFEIIEGRATNVQLKMI
jgi:site-specific DNA-methyltransferase (adenine-specific)